MTNDFDRRTLPGPQARRDVIDVMNLRDSGTVEDEVYEALSERFRNIFDVLGQLPDSFEKDWVDEVV